MPKNLVVRFSGIGVLTPSYEPITGPGSEKRQTARSRGRRFSNSEARDSHRADALDAESSDMPSSFVIFPDGRKQRRSTRRPDTVIVSHLPYVRVPKDHVVTGVVREPDYEDDKCAYFFLSRELVVFPQPLTEVIFSTEQTPDGESAEKIIDISAKYTAAVMRPDCLPTQVPASPRVVAAAQFSGGTVDSAYRCNYSVDHKFADKVTNFAQDVRVTMAFEDNRQFLAIHVFSLDTGEELQPIALEWRDQDYELKVTVGNDALEEIIGPPPCDPENPPDDDDFLLVYDVVDLRETVDPSKLEVPLPVTHQGSHYTCMLSSVPMGTKG
jgi:hypothetical protein